MATKNTAMTTIRDALARDVAPLVERVVTITEDAQAHVVHTSRRRNGGFARIFHAREMMERFGDGGLLPQAGGVA